MIIGPVFYCVINANQIACQYNEIPLERARSNDVTALSIFDIVVIAGNQFHELPTIPILPIVNIDENFPSSDVRNALYIHQ